MMNLTPFFLITGFLIIGLLIYIVILYNGLILVKVNIDKSWANIDVLLKQRHDEVPNLVEVVKGIQNFEQKTLTDLVQARAEALGAVTVPDKAQTSQNLTSCLNRLFAVAENYPTLKAQGNFLLLQERLSGLENEIADRRTFYNDSVAIYNVRIAQFPDALLASLIGLIPRELFQVGEKEKAVVPVELKS
jgi:LemA protein